MTARQSMFMVIPAALALGWAGTIAAADDQKFPASGQTTKHRPGDDGTIQAGATLRYKDNRNGTITDQNTQLVWEKKSDDLSIHDKDNAYEWDSAFDVHVFTLNNTCANNETVDCSVNGNADCAAASVRGKCGFAGKRDWRLPNVKELQSIVNYQNFNPAVSSAFNTNCVPGVSVTGGSCTAPPVSFYWSSTTFASTPVAAWEVQFDFGFLQGGAKSNLSYVRAVRGGSP